MELVENKKYNFNNKTIYWEMATLLYGKAMIIDGYYHPSYYPVELYDTDDIEKYYGLDTKGKVDAVNTNLKHFLIAKLRQVQGLTFKDLNDKTIPELVDLISTYCLNEQDVWDVAHYINGIIGEIRGMAFTIWGSDDESLRDLPCIDLDKWEIQTHKTAHANDIFKLIYCNLFNPEFLESGMITQKQYRIEPPKPSTELPE